MFRIRGILVAGLVLGTIALAAPAGASPVFNHGFPKLPGLTGTPGFGAGWSSLDTASQTSATIVVPPISCAGNPSGTTAGQFAGVQLWTDSAPETADVRMYCEGHTAVYDTEFVENDVSSSTQVFLPAGVAVRPGNVVSFDITANANAATMQITNLSTWQHAFVSLPGFVADDGFDAVVGPPSSNGEGGILTSSTVPAGSAPNLTGPVPSLPVAFLDVQVDGAPLSHFTDLYTFYWTSDGTSAGTTLADATPVYFGDNFAVSITQ